MVLNIIPGIKCLFPHASRAVILVAPCRTHVPSVVTAVRRDPIGYIYLFIYLSIHPSIHPSIYLYRFLATMRFVAMNALLFFLA